MTDCEHENCDTCERQGVLDGDYCTHCRHGTPCYYKKKEG